MAPAKKIPTITKRPSRLARNEASSAKPYFRGAALTFLRNLARNNRREWFEPRKGEFEQELKQPMLALIEAVTNAMTEFAPMHVRPASKNMMRIYRDTRFSADKRPYKNHVAAWWSCAGLEKTSGAGFYVHISPKDVVIAAGAYMPERDQLFAIRTFLLTHHAEVRQMLEERKLRRVMDSFSGLPLTRPPKGFPKEHPGMDLILCRQWGLQATLPAKEALKKEFAQTVISRFRLAAPLVDALNQPLMHRVEKKRRPLFGLI